MLNRSALTVLATLLFVTACAHHVSLPHVRAELDEVARARAENRRVDLGADFDPTALEGLSRKELEQALGPGARCPDVTVVGEQLPLSHKNCAAYVFFTLPSGWQGGGRVLILQFDSKNIVQSSGFLLWQ